ncbi:hypothetical protein GGP80_000952 [Salinibacter ruber]|uniref:Uncharacterized protein n=1 Tax=Salinibacter ruber (strain DSM 13855 / M31) TaxID=309807 RepID=Q2S5J6_SALRD|nr:hypothetical protein [Salinibacter ruber]ABC46209.1 hypothetical protein SRU_0390 [Salinibacter ruber DSM 13855]MBB4061081.1 hypothetical protein [Salinibacter ruber]MBB4070013.1 hypothetical protein [Salinibacter ruber]MCS3855526.1 hypothetical protein [Salinibacter ruber]MCS3934978.1 hypothetical protein [Salinibacter ruber]
MSDDSFLDSIRFSVTAALSLLAFVTILVGGGYYVYRWTAPKYEEAQRETYEQSRQHVEGTVEDLMRYRVKYQEADSTHKDAVRKLILRRARDIDRADMPKDLRQWVEHLRTRTDP